MKRQRLLFSLLMAIVMMAFSPTGAWAVALELQEAPANVIELKAGDNNVVIKNPTSGDEWGNDPENPAHYTLFKYTVKADGDVTIKSVGDLDTYGTLYDASMNFIKYNDDDGDGSNFKLVISDAKAGDVYCIGARGYGSTVPGNYIINVEAPLPECAPGAHDLTLHERVAATCTTAGSKTYYECSKCEKMFADEEGTEEISDVIIPALGHDLDAEGKCQREGCDYSIPQLVAGDNNVVIENPTTGEKWTDDRENPEHYTMFMYKATGNGRLAIKSVGDIDTYGALFDANMVCLADNDAYIDNPNFGFFIDAKVGDVYYIGARGYWNVEVGNYIINVVAPPPVCAPGEHDLTPHESVAATCTTAGSKTYYECSKCNSKYTDEQCTEMIFDIVIPALGHDFGEDGNCSHAGCDVKIVVKVLKTGDNNVVIENPTSADEWDNDRKNPEHYTLFRYTVKADGDITFRSVGGNDTYCVLYDSSMEYLDFSDGNDENGYSDFVLVRNNVKAGEVYYLGARGYGHYVIGDYIICVEATLPECAPGEHKLTLHEGVPATCTTAGTKAYYECSKCEHRYTDAAGTEEIADLVIPALGHAFDADGKCQHAGCDVQLLLTELKIGNNNVNIQNPNNDWDASKKEPANYTMFRYTVKSDGPVVIKGVGGMDTYGVLYDAGLNYIGDSDDDDGSNFKFSIENAKAGDVYYLGARGFYEVGDYIINVDAPSCAPGEHELTLHEAVAATCTTAGTKAYYECSKCEKMFADEEGTEEITEIVIIPALGHDLDADGKCQREGCDYSNLLVAGDNNVVIENPTLSDGDWWDAEDDLTPRHYTLFKLVVAEDNGITIKGVGDLDTYGVLYDAGMNYIRYSDDDNGRNFMFSIQDAKAGDVYYVGARWYNDQDPAAYTINVTYGPVEDDPVGPVGPVDPVEPAGMLSVNGTQVNLVDGDAVDQFNSANEGKIHIDYNCTIIENQPHYVLKLNNAEINVKANTDEEADGDMDKKPDAGIIYAGNVPLIVELTGKNTINIVGAEETAVGILAMSELMFTGSGSLDVNCTDGTAPLFIGIEAKDMIAYDKQTVSMFRFPMDLSFSGSININGKAQKVALGMGAINDMLLFSGEYNINTESAQNNIELDLSMMTTGIFAGGNIAFIDTKVKINSSKKGILLVGGDDDDDDDDDPNAEPPVYEDEKLMPMKSSRKAKAGSKSQSPLMAKAKAGKKKINVMGTPPCDFWVEGADVEIEAADGAISSLRQNPSWGPRVADGGTMHLTIGTSKENAETQEVPFNEYGSTDLDLFAETSGKNYVHIYETGEATMDVELYDGEEKRNDYLKIVVGHIEGCDTYSAMFFNYGPAYLNFTLHRTFKNDGWYTLCLPFDLEVAGSPFSKAAHFAGVDISGVKFSFGFNTVDKMHAGIPYLVKVDHEVMNPEFKNMKLVNYMPSYESHVAESSPMAPPYVFNGCYDPVDTFGDLFAGLGSGNKMKAIANGTTIRGFRGFFTPLASYEQLVNGGNTGGGGPIEIEAKKMTFTINGEIEGAATDIDPDLHVERNAGNDKTYNVMGQRVNKNAKGLIIRNGKTILKK